MSLKRYAIIAAVSYHNNQQQQNNSTTTTAATTTVISSSLLSSSSSLLSSSAAPPQLSITTARTSLFSSSSTNYETAGGGGNNNNIAFTSSNGSSIPAYYGGLSLFHQQNIRSGSGSGIGNGGSTYPNAINGNVNLLLGGAMLSLVTTILCVVCYCCHRNIKKRTEAAYRQQRQWLESDPNMEIYSVEQCYETSGLFMGESTDGLSTLPTLHHEPPPSYDAVVAMYEQQLLQQQQQAMLQQQQQFRMSPPPGYRSSLDVSAIALATATTAGRAACVPAILHLPIHNSNTSVNNNNNINNNTTSSSNSVDNINDNSSNACVTRYNFAKQLGNRNLAHPLLNMKKLWNAQSCCSLQRAEVENMWNAAAAAVAARATHASAATSSTAAAAPAAATPENMLQQTTNFIARKSLPSYMLAATTTAAKLSVNELGRRYLNQSQYRRGCPLCGKFRHDDVNESLSLSTESGLDNLQSIVLNNNALEGGETIGEVTHIRPQMTTTASATVGDEISDDEDYNNNNSSGRILAEHRLSGTTDLLLKTNIEDADAEDEECSCGIRPATVTHTSQNKMSTRNEQNFEHDNDILETRDMENNDNASVSPQIVIVDTSIAATDNNANPTTSTATLISSAAEENSTSTETVNTNGNSDNTNNNDTVEVVDLDSINENGIVRLDMSKIIDRTGLPTYEAALKLESSGYV